LISASTLLTELCIDFNLDVSSRNTSLRTPKYEKS
jgi:hypothetical protein